jgi:hypothetical protein
LIFRASTRLGVAFVADRPRMAEDVAEACVLPRGAGFLISFFFAITVKFQICWQSASLLKAGESIK